VGKRYSFTRQLVKVRRLDDRVAECAQTVGAHLVDGYQNEVRFQFGASNVG
jgi:hypothetical protein